MADEPQHLPNKDVQAKVYELFEEAEVLRQEKQYDGAIEKYQETLAILGAFSWPLKEEQARDEISETQRMQQAQLEKLEKQKQFEEVKMRKNEEMERLVTVQAKVRAKELSAVAQKKQVLAERKVKEGHDSELAYDLLSKGTEAANQKDFNTAIPHYEEALQLFESIGWKSEMVRIQEMLEELREKKDQFEKHEGARLAKDQKLAQIKEEETAKVQRIQTQIGERETAQKVKFQEADHLRKNQEELSEMALAIIDEGNRAKEEEKDFETAIAKYQEARKIFKDIGWEGEAQKILVEIGHIKEEMQKYQRQQQFHEIKRKEQEAEQERVQKLDEARQRLHKKETAQKKQKELKRKENEEYQQQISSQAFQLVDEAENLAKDYENSKKRGEYVPYPSEEILAKYGEAKRLLIEGGWQSEAKKLDSSMIHHQNVKEQEDQWLQREEEKQQKLLEEEREIDALARMNQRELAQKRREAQQKRETDQTRRKQSDDVFAEGDRLADEALTALEEHRYEDAVDIYRQIQHMYEEISWIEGTDRMVEAIRDARGREKNYIAEQEKIQQLGEQRVKEEEEIDARARMSQRELVQKRRKEQQQLEADLARRKQSDDVFAEGDRLAGEALQALEEHRYQDAVDFYRQIQQMYEKISWVEGIDRMAEAIRDARAREQSYIVEQEKSQQLEEQRVKEEEEIEAQVRLSEKERQEKKRKEKLSAAGRQKRQKVKEDAQNQVLSNLEKVNTLVESEQFDEAISLINSTLGLFKKIDDPVQEGQVQDLIQDINLKKADFIRRQEHLEKKQQEQEESERAQEELIRKSEDDQRQREDADRQKALERMQAYQEQTALSGQAYALLDDADTLFAQGERLQGIAKLQEVLEFFQQLEWKKEYKELSKRIELEEEKYAQEQERQRLFDKSASEQEIADKAYQLLDGAGREFKKKKFQRGMEILEQALSYFKELGWEKETAALERRMEQERIKFDEEQERRREAGKTQQEKQVSEKAYLLLDNAEALFKRGKHNLGLQKLQEALESFTQLGWEKEVQAIQQRITQEQGNVQLALERRKLGAKSTEEKEQADQAFALLDEGENHLRKRQLRAAIAKYEGAAQLFKRLGWTREMQQVQTHVTDLQRQIDEEIKAREDARKEQEQLAVSPAHAFELLDESEKLFRNRKIDDAINVARQVKQIFETQGWDTESAQVGVFIETLEEEKRKQDARNTNASKNLASKTTEESPADAEKQRIIEERRKHRLQERHKSH